jgi:hypothetical protein
VGVEVDLSPAGEFLADLVGGKGAPSEAFETFLVEQRGPKSGSSR